MKVGILISLSYCSRNVLKSIFHLKKRVFPFKGNTRLTPRNNLFLLKEDSVSLKPDIKFFNM